MDLEELFAKKEFQIPIVFESDDFKSEVSKLLTMYIDELSLIGASDEVISRVKSFRKSCAFTLSNYLKGIHSNAFDNFEKALEVLNITHSPLLSTSLNKEIMFRGRVNKEMEDYTSDQMYHIPLNRRGVISTQRYSFPGLPCLYTGASVYTCWVEMNRPSFERFQVATIKSISENGIMMMDLSNIPQRLNTLRENGEFSENDYLLYWPLLALCSVKVNHEDDPFKPEYIFPQFLLEHILKTKNKKEIAGIKYASIKSAAICQKQFEDDWHTYVNYVFPSYSDSMSGMKCKELNKRFIIEKNRSGRDLQILTRILEIDNAKTKFIDMDQAPTKNDIISAELGKRHVYTKDGEKYSYILSAFGMTEMALLREGFADIDESSIEMQRISEDEIDEIFKNTVL